MIRKIVDSIKYIKLADLFAPILFLLFCPLSFIYRIFTIITKKELYLICENGNTARDNGYCLFRYIKENHPEINCKYVISKKSPHFDKVDRIGDTVEWHGFKHWLYYLGAKYNIVTQKNANPNQPFFYILHVYLNFKNNRVFLQHGITKDDAKWLYYKKTKFKFFICGAKKEYEFIREKFGYPNGSVCYTGFPRFDTLKDLSGSNSRRRILICPTWRNWLGRETNVFGKTISINETTYYKAWMGLLKSKEFNDYIKDNNIDVVFYLHSKMQKYRNSFTIDNSNISIASIENDLQTEMKKADLMITDYSSVYMDFGYMIKPVIYYHFDYEEYRQKQYSEGYFDYKQNGFGPVVKNLDELLKAIVSTRRIDDKYAKREKMFFQIRDNNNCKRVCEIIGVR